MGLRRVGAVGLGTGQDKISHAGCTDTWHCHVSPFTEHCYRIPSQGTVSGLDKSSRAGGADGAVAQGHGIATQGYMEIIMKFGEALPCVKSHVSRTSGTIYAVM